MKAKTKTLISVLCAVSLVGIIFGVYFSVTYSRKSKTITATSYDGLAKFVLDTTDENIKSFGNSYEYEIEHINLTLNDEKKFFDDMKKDSRYVRTFEYGNDASKVRIIQLLMLYEQHYFVIEKYSTMEFVFIKSLYSSFNPYIIFPTFNNDIFINITDDSSKKVYTIDELNSQMNSPMIEKAYTCYEDVKEFYSKIDPDLYLFNDEGKEIKLKVYSQYDAGNLVEGTNYYEGYPLSIKFLDDGNVEIAYDLSLIYK